MVCPESSARGLLLCSPSGAHAEQIEGEVEGCMQK